MSSIASVNAAAWDACLPGEPESHAYYRACEAMAERSGVGLRVGALCATDATGVIAVAPALWFDYRLDTPLQGRWRGLANAVHRRFPGLLRLRVLCAGSPYGERCHLGFAPHLDAARRAAAFAALAGALAAEADRREAHVSGWKDLAAADEKEFAPLLGAGGFARIGSLPVAVLDLSPGAEDAWLAGLSAATRKDIRRKLAKSAAGVQISFHTDISACEAEVEALYESTRQQSALDYGDLETLPPGYFGAVSRALGEQAVFAFYRVDDELAAFNLLLVGRDRVIDKFLGMRYPLARAHNLYAVSWMTNVRFCLERGLRLLQTGQTAYAAKLRFGSRLEPSVLYVRHRRAPLRWALRRLAPWLDFARHDPDLASLRNGRTP
ncbi:GNAT family N-acetyltransferase [Camelimonas fluminis]|uniref:GNAT family N-acetyltransferase n=1 Tax=Camelimonas fluminis TaxID=1576911 RepID=A0ABV7UHL6_9HYPH|nr:GNAT family N-acetyltransferase [Camelimonas fluminis]